MSKASAKKRIVCHRLKGLMVERQVTAGNLSRKLGMSEAGLYKKINGHSDWWYREVLFITRYFGFTQVIEVFPEMVESYSEVG